MSGRLRLALAVVALGVVTLVPRVVDLGSDPPSYWPYGMSSGDEGFWNYAPAFAAARGEWPEPTELSQVLTPLYVWLQRGVFSALGVGLWQARVLSVAAGLLTTVSLLAILRPMGSAWALLGAALYASSFWTITVDRTAQPEALCTLLLTLSLLSGCAAARGRPPGLGLAALASVAAAAAKPPAVFGLVALTGFVACQRPRARGLFRALLLSAIAVGSLLAIVWLSAPGPDRTAWLVAQGQSVLRAKTAPGALSGSAAMAWAVSWAASWEQALLFYPFVACLWVPFGGVLALLCIRSRDAADERQHAAAVIRYACAWLLAWWLLVPLSVFRTARIALISVPLILLGTLGLRACSRPLAGALAPWRRAALAVAVVWLAAMWSAWLADRTSWRARSWLVLLVPALSIAVWSARRFAERGGFAPWPRAATIAGAALVVAVQLVPFLAWLPQRSHLVADAQARLGRVPLGASMVCGDHAAALLFATPGNGRPLQGTYARDCRYQGRLADYVLLPRGSWCLQSFPQTFMVANAAALGTLPEQARVTLAQWQGSTSRLCELSLIRLPRSWAGGEPTQ